MEKEVSSADITKIANDLVDLFINGNSATDATQFDGIDKAVTGSTTERNTAAVIDLSDSAKIDSNYKDFLYQIRKLEAAMDEKPTHYLMNSDLYAVFQTIADRVPNIHYVKNELGEEVLHYGKAKLVELGDKPGTTNPIIANGNVSISSTNYTGVTSLYAVRMGLDGVHGVSPDGNTLIKHYYPDFKTAGAVKKGEVEFVGAIAIKATKSVGAIRNIKVA